MSIEGWAYSKNVSQEVYYNRYKVLKDSDVDLYTESVNVQYGRKTYRGKVIDGDVNNLSALDIGLICDKGNLCFGGTGSLSIDGVFNFTVYTD